MLTRRSQGLGQRQTRAVTAKDDRALFDEVFLPNLAEAYRLAQWLTGNASDAEDVVQDAALRAFRGIKGFGAINARAWSLTIVRNTAYSWLMKNRPKAVVLTEELGPADMQQVEFENTLTERLATPEDDLILKADIADVRRALTLLPAPFREIIVLREMHELNYRDIAEVTNIPIGTVMSRLARARQLLIGYLRSGKS
ncbi:MAG: sigma-70 family RNA polymerase sigma factor [Afipia sp.]|nr:sigma-70 family RNA polymerase sigma factor [Afipia sp.]